MLKRIVVMLPALVMLLCSAAAPRASSSQPAQAKGHLLIAGGGSTVDAIVERAFALAGGKDARCLIVPQASADAEAGESSKSFWIESGGTNVGVLDLTDRSKALAAIASADFIWMPGGSQSRLVKSLTEADVIEAIVARYRAGAVVGGTSAGAAAVSSKMILGGDRAIEDAIQAGGTQVGDGLGLLPSAIVDQHFVARRRFNRLLACVLDHPTMLGVGIDERTALVVSGDAWEVIGDGNVLIIDARNAKRTTIESGRNHTASDVRLHLLGTGDRFSFGKEQGG